MCINQEISATSGCRTPEVMRWITLCSLCRVLDVVFKLRPTVKPVFARDNQLGISEREFPGADFVITHASEFGMEFPGARNGFGISLVQGVK